jgi:uncharacterized membrane protein (DUF2068 family)
MRRRAHVAGLRTVGLLEILKGLVVATLAYLVSHAIRHDYDFEDLAERILERLHISIDHSWTQHILNWADKLSDVRPTTILLIAGAYAILRFAEGYGLWRQRVWAEWLAIISGALYIPLEVQRLVRHPTALHWTILIINLLVVLYIGWVRWDEIKAARDVKERANAGD